MKIRNTRKSPSTIAIITLFLLFSATGFGQTPSTPKAKPLTIPFEMNMGRIYVDAFVNQRGPFRFMVDTGASGYARVDAKLVKELKLAVTGTATSSDGINRGTSETLTLDSLRVGEITRRGVAAFSRNYNAISRPGTAPIMGIIGIEFFADHLLTIDYLKSELVVSQGSLNAAEPYVMRYDREPVVPFRIGQHEGNGFLDTGSSVELHLPLAWAKRLGIENLHDAGEGRRANTTFKMLMAESPVTIEIGGNKVTVANPLFSESTNDIIIGARFLENHRCVITLDHRKRLVRVIAAPTAKQNAPDAKADAGLSAIVGKYGERTISLDDGLLFLRRLNGARLRLLPFGEGVFQINIAGPNKPVLTFKKENGKVTGYSMKGPDGNDVFIEKGETVRR